MLVFNAIGNLAADAEVRDANGRKFVSFVVYHSEKFVTAGGEERERVQRVSCALNGDGGKLLPFLRKGVKVFVSGRGSTNVYSSPKERAMVAGVNIAVDHVELCGGSSDEVPRQLFTTDGVAVDVHKAYFIEKNVLKELKCTQLIAERGGMFNVDKVGFVTPMPADNNPEQQNGQK